MFLNEKIHKMESPIKISGVYYYLTIVKEWDNWVISYNSTKKDKTLIRVVNIDLLRGMDELSDELILQKLYVI